MSDLLKNKWDESYQRKENFIFYPKEEVVKFLNRFVRKKTGPNEFRDILDFSGPVKALDFGCGIGRQAILMHEFGCEAYGIDLSSSAIETAKSLANTLNYPELKERFTIYKGGDIPFGDNFFDVSIAECVLDSMYFDVAVNIVKELGRVTNKLIYISLISGISDNKPREYDKDEIVKTTHEEGTVQSFYNYTKLLKLISIINFEMVFCNLSTEESVIGGSKNARYYVVLKNKG